MKNVASQFVIKFCEYTLQFKRPAGTSRGILTARKVYLLLLTDFAPPPRAIPRAIKSPHHQQLKWLATQYNLTAPEPTHDARKQKNSYLIAPTELKTYLAHVPNVYMGEVAPLPGLSVECTTLTTAAFHNKLKWLSQHATLPPAEVLQHLKRLPALCFGYELAWQGWLQHHPSFNRQAYHRLTKKTLEKPKDFQKNLSPPLDAATNWDKRWLVPLAEFSPTDFLSGMTPIIINGLIWMGDYHSLKSQVQTLLKQEFTCLKIKLGQNLQQELALLRYIRQKSATVTLRADFNGSLTSIDEAQATFAQLQQYNIDYIEQPLAPTQTSSQRQLVRKLHKISPIDLALDEELIGKYHFDEKYDVIQTLRPHVLILKPTLLGGFSHTAEWIALAEHFHCRWVVTSALESTIALTYMAQWLYPFVAKLAKPLAQGLGTGELFSNNFPSNLVRKGEKLYYRPPT